MNIDFSDRPGFSFYVIFLMLAGIVLVIFGTPVARRMTPLRRIVNIVIGAGYFGYGFYLAFIFSGGHYVIFFYAFVVPIILIVRAFASSSQRRGQPAPPPYGQPYAGQPYAGQPYAGQPYAGQPIPDGSQFAAPAPEAPQPPKPTMPQWPPPST